MYADYFGLKQAPFSIAPDPHYLFMSDRHREALAHLLYGLGGGGGFVLLTGEIGAGKTTVCRCFLEQIPKRCNVAYIFNPKLTVIELMKSVCDEFRIPTPPREPGTATVTDYLDPLNVFLLSTHAVGQNNVLIIDEAQNLSADVLEQLRLMTNLETAERKLLQIVLIGQPELREMLAQPNMQQLAQRVIARFHLGALSEPETAQYIRHRLAVAGLAGPIPFAADTLQRIHRICRGVPRRINLLCDRALLGAYATQKALVDRHVVDKAASEVFDADYASSGILTRSPSQRRTLGLTLAAGLAVGGVAAGGVAWWFGPSGLPTLASSSTPATATAVPAASAASAPSVGAAQGVPQPALTAAAAASASKAVASAASSASAAAASEPQPFIAASAFERLPRRDDDAWRALASLWNANLGVSAGDPCVAAQAQQLPCYRATTTLAVIRQLGRPGIVTLLDGNGKPAYALLTGLGSDSATLQVGDGAQSISLAELAVWWRGDFATFWRAPAGYRASVTEGQVGAVVDALATQLATWFGEPAPSGRVVFDGVLKARLAAFQRAQGLTPDGIAGPTTFMQLNRASGVDEPLLSAPVAGR